MPLRPARHSGIACHSRSCEPRVVGSASGEGARDNSGDCRQRRSETTKRSSRLRHPPAQFSNKSGQRRVEDQGPRIQASFLLLRWARTPNSKGDAQEAGSYVCAPHEAASCSLDARAPPLLLLEQLGERKKEKPLRPNIAQPRAGEVKQTTCRCGMRWVATQVTTYPPGRRTGLLYPCMQPPAIVRGTEDGTHGGRTKTKGGGPPIDDVSSPVAKPNVVPTAQCCTIVRRVAARMSFHTERPREDHGYQPRVDPSLLFARAVVGYRTHKKEVHGPCRVQRTHDEEPN